MKAHLKRIATPSTWAIERKQSVFITRPHPPSHGLQYSMPISLVMDNLVKCAKTKKEVKYILQHKTVNVDGKKRTDDKYPVGLMDVLELIDTQEIYRMSLTKQGKLTAVPASKEEAKLKLCKIINKTKLPKGKTQYNFSDGRNLIVVKDESKVGDSVLLTLPEQSIKQRFKLSEGATVLLTGGKRAGVMCTVAKVHPETITVQAGDQTYVTSKQYAFVVGGQKPALQLQ